MRRWTWTIAVAVLTCVALVASIVIISTGTTAYAADDHPTAVSRMATNIAVSPYADDLFVAYEFSKLVERPLFDTMGQPKGRWDTPTMHYGASAIAVNPQSGHIWGAVHHQGRMAVNEYNDIGRIQETWNTGYQGWPANMSINRQGDISILLTSKSGISDVKADVLTFLSDGALQDMKSTAFTTTASCAVRDADGITYVAAELPGRGGIVRRIDRSGLVDAEWNTPIRPLAMADGPEDLLVAGMDPLAGGSVQRFALDGSDLGRWRVGGVPLAVDIGPDESVYLLVQPSPGLTLVVEKRSLEGRMLLRWSVVSAMFLPWLNPG